MTFADFADWNYHQSFSLCLWNTFTCGFISLSEKEHGNPMGIGEEEER